MGRGYDQWAGTYIGRCGNRADNSKSLMRFRRDVTAASRLKVLTGAFKGAILEYRRAADPGRIILQA